jgi:hypothetical protein
VTINFHPGQGSNLSRCRSGLGFRDSTGWWLARTMMVAHSNWRVGQ